MSEDKSQREINIDDLLAEPIVRLAMKADNFSEQEIRGILRRAANALRLPPIRTDNDRPLLSPEGSGYRHSAGVLLLNRVGLVFIGRRVDRSAWQLPQGGIEEREAPVAAALRELREEIGTSNVTLLGETAGWFRYDLPLELVGRVWNGKWKGQEQKWFAMRFEGADDEINVSTEHPEFAEWRWTHPERLISLAAPFKRQVYLEVLREFSPFFAATSPDFPLASLGPAL